jgi:hypothetical protein
MGQAKTTSKMNQNGSPFALTRRSTGHVAPVNFPFMSHEVPMLSSTVMPLPFTRESVLRVLEHGAHPEKSPYSHKQIAEWCDRFWRSYLEVDAPSEIEELLPILTDVDTQWELYLANTYSIEELRSRSFEEELLPTEWFQEWLAQVEA